jgi:cell division protein FtsW
LGSKFYYRYLHKLALPFIILAITGIALTFSSLGLVVNNARRWLNLGVFSFQPSEILKLAFVIYLSVLVSKRPSTSRGEFRDSFIPFMILSALVGGLLFAQPATSTAVIILGTGIIIYLVSGAKLKYVMSIILLGVITIAILVYATPYRMERVKSFLSQDSYLESSNYQLNRALIGIGSEGFWGVGFGRSTIKYKFLPEPIGDSIFAVIGEEFGFIGSVALIILFIFFTLRTFKIAENANHPFGTIFAVGIITYIIVQSFVNIAAMVGVLPLSGIPLLFVSQGGTALLFVLAEAGILLNISKSAKMIK